MAQTELVDKATHYLLDRKVRLTSARRLVIRSLADHPGPRSAAELDAAMRRKVPLSSIYRTLLILEESGLLTRFRDGDGVAKYELSERVTGDHHHHFVCTRCGRTDEVAIPKNLEEAITRLIGTIGNERGYEVTDHRLELEGVCEACRA
ncbi:MAG: Fur family transcriptional regulator [Acidimicrobiia bacterium]